MKHTLMSAAAVLTASIILSCGGEGASGRPVPATDESLTPVLVSTLSVGLEMGDTCYVFGDIRDACITEDGKILVLDDYDNTINAYDRSGKFLQAGGGRGEGPGEYGNPFAMSALEDGGVVVTDPMLTRVTYLNPDLSVRETVSGFVPWPPERISAASGRTFAGSHRIFDREHSLYGHRVALWKDSPEPELEYYRGMGNFNMERLRESVEARQVVFTSDFDGRVYIAPISTTEYRVDVFDSTGVLLYSIAEEREQADRPLEEIEREREEMREQLEREGAPEMQWNPVEQYHMIPVRGLGVDPEGRLWVRDGRSAFPCFSVYSDAAHLFDIQIEDPSVPSFELGVKVTPFGILAWQGNPETYPVLFVLEID